MRNISLALACALFASILSAEEEFNPQIVGPSGDAEAAIKNFQLPKGMKAEVFASEPQLANPVSMYVDLQGRVYIAETFRAGISDVDGVTGATFDSDLPHRTVDERIEWMKKRWGADVKKFEREHERVRMLVDTDGDGKADRSTVFMESGELTDGIGAGVLAYKGDVYWTCSPRLWKLRDTKGDGVADKKEALHYGYGVHGGIRGHDLHGLRIGPDGKLYFTMGDRGFHVVSKEGKTLSSPDTGGVLRCNLDGSDLEIFCVGLRNSEDLTFDEYGNLFTTDNDAGLGDKCRVMYLVEGADNGWRNANQFIRLPRALGMWNDEKQWQTAHKGQPAFVIPAMAHLTNGPAGMTYYPGTGLPEHFEKRFFICDFRYSAPNAGVHTFHLKPKGASFEFADVEKSIWGILLTDIDFGPDSQLYGSDWVSGGEMPKKGRVYRLFDTELAKSPLVLETKKLLNEGMEKREPAELIKLLAHPNQKVRQEAQFELAARGKASVDLLAQRVANKDHQLARIHAIWALGQIGRSDKSVLEPLVALLSDADSEVRAQAAKILGDGHYAAAFKATLPLLKDENLRVRFLAANALGKFGNADALQPLLELLRDNADADPFVRHGAVMGLVGTQKPEALLQYAGDTSASVRMGIVLALRRFANRDVARFLTDTDPLVAMEAVRAVHDAPIVEAMPQLAKWVETLPTATPAEQHGAKLESRNLVVRSMNANFRVGKPENAAVLAKIVQRNDFTNELRVEALEALTDWAAPRGRDRVLNTWRPLEPRDPAPAIAAVKPFLLDLLNGSVTELQIAACQFAAKYKINEANATLHALVTDDKQPAPSRLAAFNALTTQTYDKMIEVVRAAIGSKDTKMRQAALQYLAALNPADAVPMLAQTLHTAGNAEKQTAIGLLAKMKRPDADEILASWLDKLLADQVPAEIKLDLLDAAQASANAELKQRYDKYKASLPVGDELAPFKIALTGGDAALGRKVFLENEKVQCFRCHKVGGKGGEVGPELSKVSATKDRNYLLESLILPNAQIAPGFEVNVVAQTDGKVVIGIVKTDDEKRLVLLSADGKQTEIPKDQIKTRRRQKESAMPPMGEVLTKAEIRNVIEYLSTLK